MGAAGVRSSGRLSPRLLGVGHLRGGRGYLPRPRRAVRRHDGPDERVPAGHPLHRSCRDGDWHQPARHRHDGQVQHAAGGRLARSDGALCGNRHAQARAGEDARRTRRARLFVTCLVDPLAVLRFLLARHARRRARAAAPHFPHLDRHPLPRRAAAQHAAPRRRPLTRRRSRALLGRLLQRARAPAGGPVARLRLPARRKRVPDRLVQCRRPDRRAVARLSGGVPLHRGDERCRREAAPQRGEGRRAAGVAAGGERDRRRPRVHPLQRRRRRVPCLGAVHAARRVLDAALSPFHPPLHVVLRRAEDEAAGVAARAALPHSGRATDGGPHHGRADRDLDLVRRDRRGGVVCAGAGFRWRGGAFGAAQEGRRATAQRGGAPDPVHARCHRRRRGGARARGAAVFTEAEAGGGEGADAGRVPGVAASLAGVGGGGGGGGLARAFGGSHLVEVETQRRVDRRDDRAQRRRALRRLSARGCVPHSLPPEARQRRPEQRPPCRHDLAARAPRCRDERRLLAGAWHGGGRRVELRASDGGGGWGLPAGRRRKLGPRQQLGRLLPRHAGAGAGVSGEEERGTKQARLGREGGEARVAFRSMRGANATQARRCGARSAAGARRAARSGAQRRSERSSATGGTDASHSFRSDRVPTGLMRHW
mmetsp:Transcript_5269/g.17404  ORF Transcript_5269/g.17404 Transcript_5269/m.17404 type:complete len:652 (+) Transcript_5269:335-2290(+)